MLYYDDARWVVYWHALSCDMCDMVSSPFPICGCGFNLWSLGPWMKECWLPLSPPWTFGRSWPNLLLGLVKSSFINLTTHCLTYFCRKQGLNNGPILFLFYCSLIHLFKSSHLLWPMWRVWEAHVSLVHLDEAQLDIFEHAPYYWASWWAWAWRCMLAMDWALSMIWP